MDDVFLISITGQDRPGLVSAITAIMASHDTQILDITQSVILRSVNLCVLMRAHDQALVNTMDDYCRQFDLNLRHQPLAAADAEHLLSEQVNSRFIITLLSPTVTAQHIAEVTGVTGQHGLNVERITTLNGPRYRLKNKINLSCIEFSLTGSTVNQSHLQADLLGLTTQLDADIACQQESIYRRNRRLVVFDMDSTLIEAEVIDLLAQAHGVGAQVATITEQAMRGELDFNQSLHQRLAMLKGLNESALAKIARHLPLMPGADKLIKTLKSLGYRTAVVSGGFTYFAQQLQNILGIDHAYANELEIIAGQLTGRVLGTIVDGQRKAELLQHIAATEGISLEQVIAVGDGANDLPMLSIAGLGIAFRAKPMVRRLAPQAISTLGLDSIVYLLGLNKQELDELENVKES